MQVADVFVGSPSAAEFTGINAYNVYVGSPIHEDVTGLDPAPGEQIRV
jgi:hypothetical protein